MTALDGILNEDLNSNSQATFSRGLGQVEEAFLLSLFG